MSRGQAAAANRPAGETQRCGKTVTQFLETQGAFEWMAGVARLTSTRGWSFEERRCLTPGKAGYFHQNYRPSGLRQGTTQPPRSRLVHWGQIRVYNSRYNPASAPNTLNGGPYSGNKWLAAPPLVNSSLKIFNELASPRTARRSRDRKWLISIHFGNYRLNARADIIIRGLILGGGSPLRQSHSPGSLPANTRSPRGHPPETARLDAGVKLVH